MATIVFRESRHKPWRAQIKRKGFPAFSKSFAHKKDAERWAAEQERTIDLTGLPLTIEQLRKQTVGDLVDRYVEQVTAQKPSAANERIMLEKFKRDTAWLAKKSLAFLSSVDGAKYRDLRLRDNWKPKGSRGPAKLIKPSTVRRECSTLHHIFEVARTEWGLQNLVNPFAGLIVRGSVHRRKRRLEPGEHEKLEAAAKQCRRENLLYVPLAISLAVETGMRLQEIFNLTWGDVNTETRRIEIRKSKTDHVNEYAGRTIVMTGRAMWLFLAVMPDDVNRKATVFPTGKSAFTQSWKHVVKRAGIKGLTFHDLRREAGSRFDEARLTKAEHDLMMGHANSDMNSLYIRADLNRIQAKLDEYEKRKLLLAAQKRAA